jgi:AP-3 complex subunit beta
VARLFFYIGLPSQVHGIIRPLMRFVQVSHPAGRVALKYIVVATQSIPVGHFPDVIFLTSEVLQCLFSPFYARFFIRADDISPVKQEKISILLNVINGDNFPAILREFIVCA